MSHQRLPPLNALRAFEATARHLSMKDAADELCVTPGAVSQLIKALETDLGVALFRRANRAIFLTEAGQNYLPAIRNAFRQIGEATQGVATSADSGILTVSTTTYFASVWLIPRMEAFREACPGIDLQLRTGKGLADFARDGVDVAVRHGLGHHPGFASERLFAIEMAPVATPSLVARYSAPASPRDLLAWPHVHDADRKDWSLWFQAQGIEDFGAPRGPAFDDSGLLLQAVMAAQGAGLVPIAMAEREIDAGRLVRLVGQVWPAAFAYYLVYPKRSVHRPKVTAFRDWVTRSFVSPAGAAEPL
jgi:LysR family transcriptional regulator, glycine cleavage system transcriptional activator